MDCFIANFTSCLRKWSSGGSVSHRWAHSWYMKEPRVEPRSTDLEHEFLIVPSQCASGSKLSRRDLIFFLLISNDISLPGVLCRISSEKYKCIGNYKNNINVGYYYYCNKIIMYWTYQPRYCKTSHSQIMF